MKKNDIQYLKVKITPKSPKNEITEILEDGTLKIRIKAPAEKNKANEELIRFLSKKWNVPKDSLEIVSGKTERTKLLRIHKNLS